MSPNPLAWDGGIRASECEAKLLSKKVFFGELGFSLLTNIPFGAQASGSSQE